MTVTMSKISSLALYLVVYGLSAALLYWSSDSSKKIYRILLASIAILLPCIMAGIRYGVGVDFDNYRYMYRDHADLSFAQYFDYNKRAELGTFLLIKIASIFDSQMLFFTLFAIVIYAPVAKMILDIEDKKDTFFLALFFLLSHFSTGMNIMRQVAAASIALYSLKYVYDRNFIKFVLLIVGASLFHVSSAIILPIYWMWNKDNRFRILKLKPWGIIVAYCIIAINLPMIMQLLGGRYSDYSSGEIQGRNLSILLNCFWMVIFMLFNKQITHYRSTNGLYIYMIIIGTILGFTGIFNIYLKRLTIYFNYVDFILLTQLKYAFNLRSRCLFYTLVTIYCLFMFILTYYILGQTGIFPYAYRL